MDLYEDEEIEKRQQELKQEIESLEKLKGRDRKDEVKIELNKNWIPYLQNARAVVERDRNFLEAQKNGFNNTFGKDITIEEFEELLKKVKPKIIEIRE